jgi:hypothetical protein
VVAPTEVTIVTVSTLATMSIAPPLAAALTAWFFIGSSPLFVSEATSSQIWVAGERPAGTVGTSATTIGRSSARDAAVPGLVGYRALRTAQGAMTTYEGKFIPACGPTMVRTGVGDPDLKSWSSANSTVVLLLKFSTHKSPEESNASE